MIRKFILTLWLSGALSLAAQESEDPDSLMNTVITSDVLDMVSGDEISEFHFIGNVNVVGTNLNLASDELLVIAIKRGDVDATVSSSSKIDKIIATGNVKFNQDERSAEAGRIEIFPENKTVLLTEDPVVIEGDRRVSGDKITWSEGERRARVEGSTMVSLGAMPDLGIDTNQDDSESTEGSETVEDIRADQSESTEPKNPE